MTQLQFKAIGGNWVVPPILLPASIPLELSGEGIRSRLITSPDGPDEELALRPDLTLAVVRHFLETGADAPVSLRYFGRAFRRPVLEGEPLEFDQTGFEILGEDNRLDADVRTLSAICQEVASAGVRDAQLYVGDVSIFKAVLSALDLSDDWQIRLSRAFRRREGVQALLEADVAAEEHSELAETLSVMPADKAAALLEEVMAFSKGGIVGGRTREEILERLRLRAASSANRALPDRVKQALSKLLEISGPPSVFLAQLKDLAVEFDLGLDEVISRQEKFFDALNTASVPFWSQANLSVQFGRRFDYYDGLVFELCHTALSSRRPIAAGGRYDGLVSWLSKDERALPAVGGVVRPDRLNQALTIEKGAMS
ncbi:MAG: hypothetical protein CMK09_16275 [Ponticaulis sp.]|nr:hypothetical protein [Ponticaulis sp.]|tara:strand:+ start:8316 stop:9425 length:1110 start_codon:yes stop_codon:yes gene_type:complete